MHDEIDLEKVRNFLMKKKQSREEHLQRRLTAARRDFQRIVEKISMTYNPSKIYQWGSLLEPEHFSEISDIDIALEGLSGPEEYFAILGDAAQMTDFPVDIIELDKIDAETAEHIRNKGKLVYERGNSR